MARFMFDSLPQMPLCSQKVLKNDSQSETGVSRSANRHLIINQRLEKNCSKKRFQPKNVLVK